MAEFWNLFKVLIKERLRVDPGSAGLGTGNKQKISKGMKGQYLLWLILGICFLPMLFMIGVGMYYIGVDSLHFSYDAEIVSVIVTIAQIATLILSLSVLINTLYFGNDTEILLNLPLSPRLVFITKLAVAYSFQLGTSLLVTMFTLIPFGMGAMMGPSYYLSLIYTVIIIPVLPMALGSLLSIPIMAIVAKLKKKGTISTILLCLLFAIIFLGYYYGFSKLMPKLEAAEITGIISVMEPILKSLGRYMYPSLIMGRMITATEASTYLINFGLSLLINGAILVLVWLLANNLYKKNISKNIEYGNNSTSKNGEIKVLSIEKELFNRDIKTISRNTQLGFSCYMQIILATVFPLIFSIMNTAESAGGEELPPEMITFLNNMKPLLSFAVCGFMTMFISMNMVATGAFSREGEYIVVMKSLPISIEPILKSKSKIAYLFNIVSLVICTIMCIIVYGLEPLYMATGLLTNIIAGGALIYLQIYFDLKYPRFHWRNVNEGLKNNKSSLLSLLIMAGFWVIYLISGIGMAVLAGFTSATMAYFMIWIVMTGVFTLLLFIFRRMLYKEAPKLYNKIEF